MANLPNLVLLYGGKSGEHEISQLSAASVLNNIDVGSYNIIPIGMDKQGCFFVNDYQELLSYPESLPIKTSKSKPLSSLLIDGKFAVAADIVFPVVHGPLYEDGCLQGVLELADVAYVGCNVVASSVAMDKEMTRRVLSANSDFKMANQRAVSWHMDSSDLQDFCKDVIADLGLPLFVKPNAMGSSVGIHKVKSHEELLLAIQDARRYDDRVVVEEAIVGREIEIAVLENNKNAYAPHISSPGEIKVKHKDGYYSYSAKYLDSEQTELIIPASLSDELLVKIKKIAAQVFMLLKCSGLARIDFFVNDDTQEIYLNEVNTLPGFTTISMYPKLWKFSGIEYKDLLQRLIDLAILKKSRRNNLVTDYK